VFLIGLGIFVLCVRTAGLIGRLGKTLDEVDRQIPALSTPIVTTLTHVGGIADTADATIARLGVAVGQLENVAAGATKTANTIGDLVNNVASNVRKGKTDPLTGEPL
jgi:phage-related minor tail protein